MNTVVELLSTLQQQDVKLWLDGDKLRYLAVKDRLSPELLAQLKNQKLEIIDFLKSIELTNIDYWQQQLAGNLSPIQFPWDAWPERRPPSGRSPNHRQIRATAIFPKSLETALTSLSQHWGGTLLMTLLSGFNVLLYRYSGHEDLLINVASTRRNQAEIEQTIGLFANTLIIRTNLADNPTFHELFDRVRQNCIDADRYQDVPFEQVIEKIKVEHTQGRSPLFQVKFALNPPWFDGRGMSPVELPDLQIADLTDDIEGGETQYDLTVLMREQDDGLAVVFEYNADLFDPGTIDRMLGHFQILLEGIVTNPDRLIALLPLLTPAEEQQILWDWNDTQVNYPQTKCLHELFAAQVIKTPDAVAVTFGDRQLTYRELDRQANQLAHYLQDLGVKPEIFVGICTERSIEMMVGLLAILKAGGAYVPLDPSYPQDRLSYMLTDAKVTVLLTQQKLLASLPFHTARSICLDTDWVEISQQSAAALHSDVNPTNLAYAIYTSGSTGKPKGVMIPHRGMVNYLSWCTQAYHVAEGVGSTVNSSISFDATITSLFSPLLVGGRVVMLPETGEIEELKGALCSGTEFSLVKITPAHLEMLSHLLANRTENIHSRAFIIGGEALLEHTTSFWRAYAPNTRLINEYGPTETVVGCCIYEVGDRTFARKEIPIGRPIANTQLYILDKQLQPVPIGVPGELYIGGDGVARGYINRPELTRTKFIPNPFSPEQSPRLYKTGDLARYMSDGNIDFLGRIDQQVKIRGFRIELGEIESWLGEHPQILQTAVIVREDLPGDRRLVAYCVVDAAPVEVSELSEFIATKVPNYMVPSTFVLLSELPMTPNGKIDRQALPFPDYSRPASAVTFIAPTNEIEVKLTKIWQTVLGRESIGIRDNFFELGGHSLIAVRLFAEIEQKWGETLPLATLFQAQTIEELAKVLADRVSTTQWSSLVPIQTEGSQPPLFAIHSVGGNILEYYLLAHYLGKNQPVYALQSQGLDGQKEPIATVEEMASHYIQEIKTIQPTGPYFLVGYSFGGTIAYEIARQLLAQGEEIQFLGLLDSKCPTLQKDRPSPLKSIQIHAHNLYQMNFPSKLVYIWDRIKYQINGYSYRDSLIQEFSKIKNISPQYIKLLDNNLHANQSYRPRTYSGKVFLLRSTIQDLRIALSPDLGWQDLVIGDLEIHAVPGDHFGLVREPYVKFIAEKLQYCLAQVQAKQ